MASPSTLEEGTGPRARRPLAEINVTPLVDVMLVLLIISLIAAPMLQRGVPLELPAAETARDIQDSRIVVSIDRDLRIFINDRPVHYELLEERMRAVAAALPGEIVYVRADRLLPYGEVLLVMDRIRKAGVQRIALVTTPLPREKRG